MDTDEPGCATKRFQCPSCPKSYSKGFTLKEHILIKHGEVGESKSYYCQKCPVNNVLGTPYPFATKRRLDKHIKRVHGPPRYKCQVCFKAFKDPSDLRQHQRVHNPHSNRGQGHKCDLCCKTYISKRDLHRPLFTVHKRKTDGVNYFKCELCALEFVIRASLERHVVNAHVVDKSFECSVCSKTFLDQEILDNHVKNHDTQVKHFCDICSKGFRQKDSLVHHLGQEHQKHFYCYKCLKSFSNKFAFDQHSDPKTCAEIKLEFKCQICGECFDFQCNLDIHINAHLIKIHFQEKADELKNVTGGKLEFECEFCSKYFDRESYLKAHRIHVHPNPEWNYNFEQCSKTFKRHYLLRMHKMTHSETKQFVCKICQKSFYTPVNLKSHQLVHAAQGKRPPKRFQCTSCPKYFRLERTLSDHVRSKHSDADANTLKSSYSCDKCLQNNPQTTTTYATQLALKRHIKRAHSSPRLAPALSCVCQICFKTFKSLPSLRMHRRVHIQNNSEKTHKCSLCSRSFFTNQNLRRHLFDVHKTKAEGVKYFKCDFCDVEFLSRYYLECHVVRKHVVDKEFQCAVCSKTFIDKLTLYRHIKIHDKPIRNICDICCKGFSRLQQLTRHLKTNYKKSFYCNKCLRSFNIKSEFDQHFDSKTSGSEELYSEFKCQICGLSFDSQCILDTYTNCHLSEINLHKADLEIKNLGDERKLPIPLKVESAEKINSKLNCNLDAVVTI